MRPPLKGGLSKMASPCKMLQVTLGEATINGNGTCIRTVRSSNGVTTLSAAAICQQSLAF